MNDRTVGANVTRGLLTRGSIILRNNLLRRRWIAGSSSAMTIGGRRPPSPHSENQLASTVCTPSTWMMPSTVGSAFVFNWMKVSVPLVNQLI